MNDETGCLFSMIAAIVVALSIPDEYTIEVIVVSIALVIVSWIYIGIVKTKEKRNELSNK